VFGLYAGSTFDRGPKRRGREFNIDDEEFLRSERPEQSFAWSGAVFTARQCSSTFRQRDVRAIDGEDSVSSCHWSNLDRSAGGYATDLFGQSRQDRLYERDR